MPACGSQNSRQQLGCIHTTTSSDEFWAHFPPPKTLGLAAQPAEFGFPLAVTASPRRPALAGSAGPRAHYPAWTPERWVRGSPAPQHLAPPGRREGSASLPAAGDAPPCALPPRSSRARTPELLHSPRVQCSGRKSHGRKSSTVRPIPRSRV